MSGIYVCLPTAPKPTVPKPTASKPTIPKPTAPKPTAPKQTSSKDSNSPSVSSSESESSNHNKEVCLLNAIALVEARSLLEPLVKSLLHISPKYVFEKRTNGTSQVSYLCIMIIQAKIHPKEKMYKMFEGTYFGRGLSKRLAQMDACKNAMIQWDQENGIVICDMSFREYVETILREGKRI